MEWFESLPDDLKSAPFFKPLDDGSVRELDSVITDLKGAATHMGNSIRIPGPDASDDDIKAFANKAMEKIPGLMLTPDLEDEESVNAIYNKLGRPAEAKDYTLPEGAELADDVASALRERAHTYGMSNRQFQKMVSDMTADQSSMTERQKEALTEDLNGLRGEWGEAYPVRLEKIAGLLEKTGAPAYLVESLTQQGLPSADLKWLYAMAESLGAEGKPLSSDGNDGVDVTPGEALAQLSEVENNPALWDKAHPDNKRLTAKRVELMKLAYPDSGTTF